MNQPACQGLRATPHPSRGPAAAPRHAGPAAPLQRRNTHRRLRATAALGMITWSACAGWAGLQPAQPTPEPPRPEKLSSTAAQPAPGVTPDLAMSCFSVVETWIRAWRQPEPSELPKDALAAVRGAAVVLRHQGQIVGRGSAMHLSSDTGHGERGENAIVLATRAAWREATGRLPGDRDALREEKLKAMAAEVQISLEVTGDPLPFSPLAFDIVDSDLHNGLDGVAVRMGDRVEAIFPASMLTRDQSPGDALAACIGLAAGDPALGIRTNPMTQPPAIAKSHQAVFYRFRPLHVAQIAPSGPARFLHRGGRVVSPREITTASLETWADSIARRFVHLASVEPIDETVPPHPDAEGRICLQLPGVLRFAEGKTEPVFATHRQQAISSLALSRHSRLRADTNKELSATTRNVAVRLMRDILEHIPSGPPSVETDEDYVARDVAFQQLLPDLSYEQSFNPWHVKPGLSVVTRWDPVLHINKLAALEEASPARKMTWNARGRLALALALRKDPHAGDHIRDIYRQLSVAGLHDSMPWVGWADVVRAKNASEQPSTAMLREWREQVYARMTPSQAPGADDADLAGGIPSAPGRTANADSARTVAFLATMLGDPAFTDASERPKELSRLLAALRFLRQLTVDEYAAYCANDPKAAIWGVRRSPSDQRLDPEDAAMTLIAVCESIDAIRQMQRPRTPPTIDPGAAR